MQFFMFLQEKNSAHNLWSKLVVFPLHYIIKLLQSQLNHLLSKGNTRWERGKWVCANPVLENPQNNYTVFPEMIKEFENIMTSSVHTYLIVGCCFNQYTYFQKLPLHTGLKIKTWYTISIFDEWRYIVRSVTLTFLCEKVVF